MGGDWAGHGGDDVHLVDEEGEGITVRASFTVDGDNLSADYTIQFVGEGAPEGEFGPGQVTGHSCRRLTDGRTSRIAR